LAKIGRNQPCPCGSGKKYKHCHGGHAAIGAPLPSPEAVRAEELIRQHQQGHGRPIIATKVADHQIVAVGNTIYYSKSWKTFPDFLGSYILAKLGKEWVEAELAKPVADRHPIMQLQEEYAAYQRTTFKASGEVVSAEITGVVAAYLGTAYALYLLDHNVELQARLLHRLKDVGQFQGAYYELVVASTLIRAGFTLALEDETDGDFKHCEFSAVSNQTGEKYWVEAKMRAVAGLLGRTSADGGADGQPLARLIPHLNDALAKPAADKRLVFIDVNTPSALTKDGVLDWLEPTMTRLERYERNERPENATAYVWVTNVDFHRQLWGPPSFAAAPFGLGMPDFNRPGMIRVTEAYRQRQKHADAHSIGEVLQNYSRFPSTFDGKLPSESLGTHERVRVGETYFFGDAGDNGTLGTVTSVLVDEAKKEMLIGLHNGVIVRGPISETALSEYKEFGDAYFGQLPHAYWEKNGKEPKVYTIDLGWKLLGMAKQIGLEETAIERLDDIRASLEEHRHGGLTGKNLTLIRQVLSEGVWSAVVSLPNALMRQARTEQAHAPVKAAVTAQLAVAIAILSFAPVRLTNLVSIELEKNLIKPGGPVSPFWLTFPNYDVKNRVNLDFMFNEALTKLIDEYIHDFRPTLVRGSNAAWLFPGVAGEPKTANMFSTQITERIQKATGVRMTVHQFRHACAAIYLKHRPGEYEVVRRLLGHRNIQTTINFYCGLETTQASETFGNIIRKHIKFDDAA
jgi:hypothetical protein